LVNPVLASDGPQAVTTGSPSFWDGKFFATCIVIGLLILTSAYLEYSFYPSVMQSPPYGETKITPHLSLLTFWYSAYRCVTPSFCTTVQGVPAFDFAQLLIIVLGLVLLQRALKALRN
jgi:hypothetical protein